MTPAGMDMATAEAAGTAGNLHDFKVSIDQSFVPLKVRTADRLTFSGRIRSRRLGDIRASEVCASGHEVERTEALIAQSDRNSYKLSLLLSGRQVISQDGREAALRPGDIAIYDTSRPYLLTQQDDFRVMVLLFPKTLLELPEPMVRKLTAVRLSSAAGPCSMIAPFLTQFANNLDQLEDAAAGRLAHSVLDLITTMMSNELDRSGESNGPRAVLMEQIRSYIRKNLAEPDLGPARIAAAHFISVRHLHGMFHEQGTTVSAWVRTRRLENCRRELQDPLFNQESVTEIAARWGFLDSAHFSRVFKVNFGVSPTEARSEAAGRSLENGF